MARPRSATAPTSPPLPPALASWAEAIGDAIGRAMLRTLNNGMNGMEGLPAAQARPAPSQGKLAPAPSPARRGRPPKALSSATAGAQQRCIMPGCGRDPRSKGLCSAHYQSERRRQLASRSA